MVIKINVPIGIELFTHPYVTLSNAMISYASRTGKRFIGICLAYNYYSD